jgi:hypothetical protein
MFLQNIQKKISILMKRSVRDFYIIHIHMYNIKNAKKYFSVVIVWF